MKQKKCQQCGKTMTLEEDSVSAKINWKHRKFCDETCRHAHNNKKMKQRRNVARDLTGRRFGMLKAMEIAGRDRGGNVLWKCACDCGGTSIRRSGELGEGSAKSCGCHSKHTVRQGRAIAGPGDQPATRRPPAVFTEIHHAVIYGRLFNQQARN